MHNYREIALLLLAFSLVATTSRAEDLRRMPRLSEMFMKADAVVLGVVVSNCVTGVRTTVLDNAIHLVQHETTFEVVDVLKSTREMESPITVVHYTVSEVDEEAGIPVQASFSTNTVSFRMGIQGTDLCGDSAIQYLMFLRQRNERSYELVTGPLDSLFAVRPFLPGMYYRFLARALLDAKQATVKRRSSPLVPLSREDWAVGARLDKRFR